MHTSFHRSPKNRWFTYVASLSAIEQIHASHNTTSRTSISILVSLRLLPSALFTSVGGVLADSYDRRTILWILDLLGSLVALLFLLAYHLKSIAAFYVATALQMTVAARCFIGPAVIDRFTHMDQVGLLERACCWSFVLMGIGCYGLSQAKGFLWICVFTSVRSAGSSIVWIYSSLILQKFSTSSMLGRVMAIDYALATLSEAFSAMCAGVFQDEVGLSAEQVSFLETLNWDQHVAFWCSCRG